MKNTFILTFILALVVFLIVFYGDVSDCDLVAIIYTLVAIFIGWVVLILLKSYLIM